MRKSARISSDPDTARARLLLSTIAIASEFLEWARLSDVPATSERNVASARQLYESAIEYRAKLCISHEDCPDVDTALAQLSAALDAFNESSK